MAEKHVDARGLACPQPVVLTRKAMLEAGVDRIEVLVDSEVSAENVQRFAQSQGWQPRTQRQGKDIRLTLTQSEAVAHQASPEPAAVAHAAPGQAKVVVFVASNVFGVGDDKLGHILMKAFIKTLKELDPRPAKVIFANSGVWLTTEGSDLVGELRALEQQGIAILSCGTCLDFYGLIEKLRVGVSSNMYEIATSLVEADRVVRV